MQSDTLIGIAGAVVLVAVMVGVFAYEYNNAPEDVGGGGDGDGDDQERMEAFLQAYPTLNATDDIDGDTTPNWQDDDIDGDGTANADDNITCFCDQPFSGQVPASSGASAPSDSSNTFTIASGHTGGTVTVTWSVTRNPATGTPLDDLTVTIDGGVSCTESDSGNNRVATCDLAGADPGLRTITVTAGNVASPQAKPYSGTYSIVY